jgi:hypothetical protein
MATNDSAAKTKGSLLLLRLGVGIFLLDGLMFWQDHFKFSVYNFIALLMGGICVFWGLAAGNAAKK